MNDLAYSIREALRRAILTLIAVPSESPAGYGRNPLASRVIHGWEAYAAETAQLAGAIPPTPRPRFEPTPKDMSVYLDVLGWLAWYEREVNRQRAKLFVAWAREVPLWMLAVRFQRSEDTIRRWRDGVATTIADRFGSQAKALGLDFCGKCGAKSQNHEQNGELRPVALRSNTPRYIRATLTEIDERQLRRDRRQTERDLRRVAKKYQMFRS